MGIINTTSLTNQTKCLHSDLFSFAYYDGIHKGILKARCTECGQCFHLTPIPNSLDKNKGFTIHVVNK